MHIHVRPVSIFDSPVDEQESAILITVYAKDGPIPWDTDEQIDRALENDKIAGKVVLLHVDVSNGTETFLAILFYDRLKDVARKLLISRSHHRHFIDIPPHDWVVSWDDVILPANNESFADAMRYGRALIPERGTQ